MGLGGLSRGVQSQGEGDDFAVDEAAFFECGEAKGLGGEAVEVAHGAEGGFVKQSECVFFKEVAVTACAAEPESEVLCGVCVDQRLDAQAGVEA